MAGLTRWRPGATRTGGVMGLTTEHDGPGRPAGPDRQVEGYETVPLLIAGTAGNANGNGMAVLRRCPARPSKRAVVPRRSRDFGNCSAVWQVRTIRRRGQRSNG